MKEKLISFKLAKLAKNKGFKTSSKLYTFKRNGRTFCTNVQNGISGEEDCVKIVNQALLQKWLREKHGRHIQITSEFYKYGIIWNVQVLWWDKENTYDYRNGTGMYGDNGEYATYEIALEKGLQLALESI